MTLIGVPFWGKVVVVVRPAADPGISLCSETAVYDQLGARNEG